MNCIKDSDMVTKPKMRLSKLQRIIKIVTVSILLNMAQLNYLFA